MKSFPLFRIVLVLACLALGATAARAEDVNSIKARMEQRLGAVLGLKDRGVAGENNRGFLEMRGGGSGSDQQVISEENSDRRAVYADIASKTGASADAVGRQRAQQLASIAKRGHWIQDANGEWRQKT
jgi:hypothetical protein